ncbi:MAG: hypothetical protein J7K04_12100 [Spirochaetales bacterium]|nr:hypothetical protein [Spirochaetales bacterium]
MLLILLPILFELLSKTAFGESSSYVIRNFIRTSTRDFNPIIIYWINNYDLEKVTIIVKTLSKCQDYFIGDIISDLVFNRTNKNKSTKEYILRILIDTFFNSDDKLSRIKENSSYLVIIIDQLQNFNGSFVKADLLKLLPLLKHRREKSILMLESRYTLS